MAVFADSDSKDQHGDRADRRLPAKAAKRVFHIVADALG